MRSTTFMAALMVATACGDPSSSPPTDAGPADGSVVDAGLSVDGSVDASDRDGGPKCEGDCRIITLSAELGDSSAGFDRAFYGLTAPESSGSGGWEIHLEAFGGGSERGCPIQGAASPDRTLIVSGIPVPVPEGNITEAAGGMVSLFDFEGSLLPDAPLARATEWVLSVPHENLCTDCVGNAAPSHPEGEVAIDVDITFRNGTAAGHIFATHCDSLDAHDD